MKKKVLALLLCAAICISSIPSSAVASVDAGSEPEETITVIVADEDEGNQTEAVIPVDAAYAVTENESTGNAGDGETEEESEPVASYYNKEAEGDVSEAESAAVIASEVMTEYTASDGDINVTVTAPAGALPENAELVVKRFAEDSSEYKDAADVIGYVAGADMGMAAVDISFFADGEEVEPSEAVTVSIDVSAILPADADPSTIEVQHLEENGFYETPVVVANDSAATEGTIDEAKAIAEFKVDGFSTFTVTWEWGQQGGATSSTSLTMTVYLDGYDISDEIGNITFTSEDHELNLENFLSENEYGTGDYTFLYATASGTRSGQGGGSITLGSETNPVVSISKTSGPNSTFEVTTLDGTTTTMSNSNLTITAYYQTPEFSVDISAIGADAEEDWLLQATLSHTGDYDRAEYIWTVTNVDESGNDTGNTSTSATAEDYGCGRALITWAEGVEDDHTVMVHVTVNLYDENNNVIGTATASYELEYSDETIDIDVTYGPSQTSVGAGVTVTIVNTADAQYTYTGTTDASGRVEFTDVHPGTYTVTTTDYTDASATYACDSNETLNLHEPGNYEVNLKYQISDEEKTYLPDKSDWNHIDIKLTLGSSSTADANSVTSFDIESVKIIASDGTVRYTSGSIDKQNDVEFQIYFNEGEDGTGEGSHTINFSSTDTIVIVYTETWTDSNGNEQTETYEIEINPDSVYPEGTTYPADGARAYKLYNYLYNTSYTSDAELMAAGVTSIDVSGLGMMTVAAILCDSSTVDSAGSMSGTAGMWGMDFALSLEAMASLGTNWAFEIEKTLENVSMDAETFGFFLYDATVSDDVWTIEDTVGDYEQGFTNAEKGKDLNGNSTDTMQSSTIAYTDDEIRSGNSIYYILYEYKGGTTDEYYKDGVLSYDDTVYGIKIDFDINGDEVAVNATYYLLTSNGSGGYTVSSVASLETSSSGYPVFQFTNTYTTDVTIAKTDEYDNPLEAQFTLTQQVTDSEENEKTCYYDPSNTSDPWVNYDSSSTESISSFTLGTIKLDTPYDGTYTLTEVTAASEYGTIPGAVEFEVKDGEIVEESLKWADSNITEDISIYVTLSAGGLRLTIMDPDTTTSLEVKKTWNDNDDHDGKRPESITVQLTADGTPVSGSTLTLNESNEWKGLFGNLPVHNSSGGEIVYGVTEDAVSGYETSIGTITGTATDGYSITVTNTHTADTGSLVVSKTVIADQTQKESETTYTVTITSNEIWSSMNLSATDSNEQEVTLTPVYGDNGTTQIGVNFTVADGSEITISGLYKGSYTVTETTSGGFTTSYVVTTKGDMAEATSDAPTVNVVEDSENVDLPQVAITNEYPVTATIPVTKTYSGTTTWPTEGFTFTLSAVTTDAPMPGTTITATATATSTNKTVSFGDITYTSDGTYYYTVTETEGNAGGVSYDDTIYYVQVTVSTSENVKTVIVKYTNSEEEVDDPSTLDWNSADALTETGLPFTNSYNAEGSLTFSATKDYTGAELTEGLFSFTITETTTGIDEENLYTSTGTNDADGNITFTPGIKYTLDDIGTHTYVVAETAGTAGGVTYDSSTITVTVDVEDNGDGTLSTIVTVNGEGVTAREDDSYNVGTFENSYEATCDVTLTATKTISGMSSTVKAFNFMLYNSDEDFTYNIGDIRSTASTTDTLTEGVAQSVTFPTITFNEAGTYYFVIIESSTGIEGDGWTYDGTEYHVTVVMTDDGNGNLIPTITYTYIDENGDTQTADSADFINTYKAGETSVQFAGTKYISNSNSTDKVFAFELYETENSFDIAEVTPEEIQTSGSIDASGQSFEFREITYEEVGTHYYVIKEQELDEANGWMISETVYYVTVEVTDNLDGQLESTVSYVTEIGGTSTTVAGSKDVYGGFDFINAYAAEGAVTLGVVKSISGVTSTDKTFSFTLYTSDENFTTGDSIETITTDGTIANSMQLNFTAIPYTKAGTYYYVITETGTAPDGWTIDSTEYHVTVTVTDNSDGTLTTSASYAYIDEECEMQTENSAAFTNIYAATGELALTGTKTFTGGDLEADVFTFTMTDSREESVGDVTMDANGNITFPTLTYNEADIGGEYTYKISEVNPSDLGVVYDDTTYIVVVSVADNKDGTLNVTYTVNGKESGDITFTNYQKGSLTITKNFTGLTDDQIENLTDFTITVTSISGDTVATLTLDDADDDSSYTWTVSDLPADTYTVTETGYSVDGYEVIAKSGTVEVTDSSDVSVDDTLVWGGEDTVEFENDYTEVGSIAISKYVVAEEDIQGANEDTKYTVVITARDDADFRWITVTNSIDGEITPTIDGRTISFTIMENETVTVSGLPAGEYTVEEQGSDAITSEHFIPTYIVGEEETEEAPTVIVASGSENVVAIDIDNEYPIGTYIQVKKDYNKDEYPIGDDVFTFTIEALTADLDAGGTLDAEEMPMPSNNTVTITSSDDDHVVLITFDNEENEFEHFGTYYYKITETKGNLEYVDYDESVHYVKVVVGFDEDTHVLTTDEWEAKADAETEDYKDLEYTEAGIVTAEFTNTAYEKLTIEKEVSGDAGDTTEYEFEITLTKDDAGFDGDIEVEEDNDENDGLLNKVANLFSGIIRMFTDDDDTDETYVIKFTEGVGTVIVSAGESVTLLIPSGYDYTVTEITTGADTTTVYKDGEVVIQAKGTDTVATAELGTIVDSTQVKFVNSYRAYFPIDEEIVTDTDDIFDRDAWVKEEAVNKYNAIEIEMTTNLPVVTAYDLANGEFTMNFHEVLDHELVLDEDTADFSVYIAGVEISTAYYKISFDDNTGDDCNFHVDVDLTALYNDGIVTNDMLDGSTEITIFFFADLEGTGLNGSYTSTIWYDIYDGDEWLYTSNESVVAVYTYEIEILKYDASTLDSDDYENSALAGAAFGLYYDEDCSDPVIRNGEPYEVTSGEDGMVIFYGLADGTYYVKEIEAPEGYVLSDEVLEVVLGEDLNDTDYVYTTEFANSPVPEDNDEPGEGGVEPGEPGGTEPGGNGGTSGGDGNGPESTVNDPGNSSATGDDSSLMLWLMMLCVSAFGIGGIMSVSFRKTKKNKR